MSNPKSYANENKTRVLSKYIFQYAFSARFWLNRLSLTG